MTDTTSIHEIIRLSYDCSKPSLSIESNWLLLGIVFTVGLLYFIFRRKLKRVIEDFITSETSFEINTGLVKFNQKIKRNYENLYIELVTRKAAIPIDKEKDVLIEIYSSWYTLFKIIREEIKNLPGEFLIHNESSKKLIDLTIEILNNGLRPHLTEYQAEFKKWYDHEIEEETKGNRKSPQEIQKLYPKYTVLTDSMLEVNKTLKQYSEQLKNFIDNKK